MVCVATLAIAVLLLFAQAQQFNAASVSAGAAGRNPNAASGTIEVPLPSQPAEIKNPSGINMGSLSNLQAQMNERVDKLEDNVQNLKEGFDEMEDNAPSVTFRGVDLRSEVIDPQVMMKEIEAYEKAKAQQERTKKAAATAASEAFVGQLSPPIIILESPDIDPLERYLMLKLITCREDDTTNAETTKGSEPNADEAKGEEEEQDEATDKEEE